MTRPLRQLAAYAQNTSIGKVEKGFVEGQKNNTPEANEK